MTRDRKARRRPMSRELQPCGTPAAYRRHLNAGQEPCQDCKDGHAAATAKSVVVTREATRELRIRHSVEYAEIRAEQSDLYDKHQKAVAWARVFAEAAEETPDA